MKYEKGWELGVGDGVPERNFIFFLTSSNIVRVIKCRTLRWVKHLARMEKHRDAFKIEKSNIGKLLIFLFNTLL